MSTPASQLGLNPNVAAPAPSALGSGVISNSVGMQSGYRGPQDFTRQITHIEIRRVQNGFVLMGFDASSNPERFQTTGTKCCYVANDAKEIAALVESIITGGDLNWLPSVDIPVTGLFKRGE